MCVWYNIHTRLEKAIYKFFQNKMTNKENKAKAIELIEQAQKELADLLSKARSMDFETPNTEDNYISNRTIHANRAMDKLKDTLHNASECLDYDDFE